jgi:hypothetical protein
MTSISNFSYYVNLDTNSGMLRNGPMASVLPNCSQMIIKSESFAEYEVCEKKLSSLLQLISNEESRLNNKNYVIVTCLNPIYSNVETEPTDDKWENSTVMKVFLADADLLKESKINYNVLAQISVDHKIVSLKSPPLPQ